MVATIAAVILAVLPMGTGWASDAELAWMQTLGDTPCKVGSPPTKRLLPSYRLARDGCTRRDRRVVARALDRALVGYDRALPRSSGELGRHRSYTNTDFTKIASAIAGKPVAAHCWAILDWNELEREVNALYHHGTEFRAAGYASIGAGSIEIESEVCKALSLLQLKAYANDYGTYAWDFGFAIDVLTHESVHARGIDDEAITECFAIQHIAETAVDLGLAARTGRLFANAMWRHYKDEPKGYATPRCRDGGPLDLHPKSAVWP